MKLRLLPIVITIVVSASLLFGGWFAWRSLALENPLSEQVQAIEGVRSAHTEIAGGTVRISLRLEPDAGLREIVRSIKDRGAPYIKDKMLDIQVDHSTSPKLEEWWSKALFDIAEAVETRQYGEIPDVLAKHQAKYAGLDSMAEMDEEYVYIRLTDGEHHKFVMLPRNPPQLEVWTS